MYKIYQEIQKRIQKIDFNKLWEGFSPCEFALYDDKTVYFETYEIPITDQFLGNTTIVYAGKQIAIWKIEENDMKDLDLLATSIVHEMYHSYQMQFGENRFFNDIKALSYPITYHNFNLKLFESKLLVQSLMEEDHQKKEMLFNKFILVRKKRFEIIGENSLYEKSMETIEGAAEYVALISLKKLNLDTYKVKLKKAIDWITTVDEKFLDIRRSAYYTGALICLVADDLHVNFKKKLEPNLKYNFDLITDNYPLKSWEIEIDKNPEIQVMINNRTDKISKIVNDIKADKKVKIFNGDFTVQGYDPMNMMRFENYVYHKHFLGINEDGKTDFVMGEIVIETDGKDFSRFSTYYIVQ